MNYQELGKKIKELRLAKKMTQNELVSGFITRSMLSQIENGGAIPSIRTLEYIAQKLKISLSDLIPDQSTNFDYLIWAKKALTEGNYEEAVQWAERLPPTLEDEAYALKAKAHWELARLSETQHQYASVLKHAQAAAANAALGVYASRSLRAEALLLLDETNSK